MRSQDDICKTDAQGEFRLQRFLKSRSEDDKPSFELLVAKPGCAVTGSEQIEFTPDETGTHRLKSTLRLAKGQSLQLKILEKDGSPAEGAWVQPRGVGAARVAKSDEEGLCLLHDLPLGLTSLIVHYGSQYANQTIVVSPSTEPEPPIRIRLTELDERRSSTVIKPKPLKPGERGPEWNVVGWSDGREHKLSDYRGRVVLIDFWGMWCGPCMQAIPAMQELHEKYAERVAFLGIHTANTEVSQVKKLLQLKKWDVLAAVDVGVDAAKSESAARYGVRGYPTFVVVGRDGRIGFNSSVPVPDEAKWMAEMKRDAEELKIPWPINKDASDQEVDGRLERLLVHRLSKELDKALAEPATD